MLIGRCWTKWLECVSRRDAAPEPTGIFFTVENTASLGALVQWPRSPIELLQKTLLDKKLSLNSAIQACHDIRSPTRSKSILGCSADPSMGRTVVSQTLMAHLLSFCVTGLMVAPIVKFL
jgi:hypothetical protein